MHLSLLQYSCLSVLSAEAAGSKHLELLLFCFSRQADGVTQADTNLAILLPQLSSTATMPG